MRKVPAGFAGGGENSTGSSRRLVARFSGKAWPELRAVPSRDQTPRPRRTIPSWAAWLALAAGCLIAGWSAPARAAAPRDAIKQMPKFVHTSTFSLHSVNKPDNTDYEDQYLGDWDIRWHSPKIDLGTAKAQLDFHYKLTLKDILNRRTEFSSDTRYDDWTAKANLDAPGGMKAFYQFEQQDTYNNSYPSSTPRNWTAISLRQVSLEWAPAGWPGISAGQTSTMTNNYLGAKNNTASESEVTNVKAAYRHDAGITSQGYSITNQLTRTNNYSNGTGTSVNNQVFDAQREIRFGNLGRLNLGVNYTENSTSGTGALHAKTTTSNNYTLALSDGRTNGPLPLTYSFNYGVLQRDYPGKTGDQQVQRLVSLGLKPPVPAGKRASVNAQQYYSEFESDLQATSTTLSTLIWSFSPNPRTDTKLTYTLQNDLNRQLLKRTNETERVLAQVNYQTPGRQSSYQVLIDESVVRQTDQRHQIRDAYNLGTTVNLSPGTFVRMFYNQLYVDNYGGLFDVPSGNDQTVSGVQYRTDLDPLSLNATWQLQQDRFHQSGVKNTTELISLVLAYKQQANWMYTFVLNSKAATDHKGSPTLGYNYSTDDTIQVTAIYQF